LWLAGHFNIAYSTWNRSGFNVCQWRYLNGEDLFLSNQIIIDSAALHRQRVRAVRLNDKRAGADFLVQHAADDLSERLSAITRAFDIVVDLNSAGSAVTDRLAKSGKYDRIIQCRTQAFQQPRSDLICHDEILPFASGSVDLIVSILNLQFVDDLPGILVQIRRALKPDGLFMGAVIGGSSLRELRQAFLEAESEICGAVRARVLPFVDVRAAGSLLQRAGFALPVSDSDVWSVRYDSAFDLMRDLRVMGAVNCLNERNKAFMRRDVLMRAVEIYAQHFSDVDGRVRATFEMISFAGWAPHESQQKPLKPGSAQINLADALRSRDR